MATLTLFGIRLGSPPQREVSSLFGDEVIHPALQEICEGPCIKSTSSLRVATPVNPQDPRLLTTPGLSQFLSHAHRDISPQIFQQSLAAGLNQRAIRILGNQAVYLKTMAKPEVTQRLIEAINPVRQRCALSRVSGNNSAKQVASRGLERIKSFLTTDFEILEPTFRNQYRTIADIAFIEHFRLKKLTTLYESQLLDKNQSGSRKKILEKNAKAIKGIEILKSLYPQVDVVNKLRKEREISRAPEVRKYLEAKLSMVDLENQKVLEQTHPQIAKILSLNFRVGGKACQRLKEGVTDLERHLARMACTPVSEVAEQAFQKNVTPAPTLQIFETLQNYPASLRDEGSVEGNPFAKVIEGKISDPYNRGSYSEVFQSAVDESQVEYFQRALEILGRSCNESLCEVAGEDPFFTQDFFSNSCQMSQDPVLDEIRTQLCQCSQLSWQDSSEGEAFLGDLGVAGLVHLGAGILLGLVAVASVPISGTIVAFLVGETFLTAATTAVFSTGAVISTGMGVVGGATWWNSLTPNVKSCREDLRVARIVGGESYQQTLDLCLGQMDKRDQISTNLAVDALTLVPATAGAMKSLNLLHSPVYQATQTYRQLIAGIDEEIKKLLGRRVSPRDPRLISLIEEKERHQVEAGKRWIDESFMAAVDDPSSRRLVGVGELRPLAIRRMMEGGVAKPVTLKGVYSSQDRYTEGLYVYDEKSRTIIDPWLRDGRAHLINHEEHGFAVVTNKASGQRELVYPEDLASHPEKYSPVKIIAEGRNGQRFISDIDVVSAFSRFAEKSILDDVVGWVTRTGLDMMKRTNRELRNRLVPVGSTTKQMITHGELTAYDKADWILLFNAFKSTGKVRFYETGSAPVDVVLGPKEDVFGPLAEFLSSHASKYPTSEEAFALGLQNLRGITLQQLQKMGVQTSN